MAPSVKPKKPLKSMEKVVVKPPMKKRIKKKKFDSYALYLYQVLRSFNQDIGISRQAMLIMNNFVVDTMENIAAEASRLVVHGKKTTLSSREIQSAVQLLIPGELGKHCHADGLKALMQYQSTKK